MHLFGLTGGIASGKSLVAARLRALGVPIIDADVLAREVVDKGTEGLDAVVAAFGRDVLDEHGGLDRKKVAREIFGDPQKRAILNAIVHPRIAALTFERAGALSAQGHPLACYEAALLVENGVASGFRPLVVVAAPEDVQVRRAMARDGATEDEVRARIAAQLPLAAKVAMADLTIDNDGTREALEARVDEALLAICKEVGVDPRRYALTFR